MGVDVMLYVETEVTETELTDAIHDFDGAVRGWGWDDVPALEYLDALYDRPRVEAGSSSRYFGPGYERGSWPEILKAIGALQEAFPGKPVFYGGDNDDTGTLCTPEFVAEMTAHWMRWVQAGAPSYFDREHPFYSEDA